LTAFGLGYSSVPPRLRYAGPAVKEALPAEPAPADTSTESGAARKAAGYLGQLLAYIPGDVVGAYLFTTGFVPNDYYADGTWVIFGVLLVGSVGAVYGGYRLAKRQQKAASEPLPGFRMVAAPVAFTVWVVSLPKSPFDPIWMLGQGWVKSIVLGLGTFAVVVFAEIFDSTRR
jgi:hypothetical protein